MSSTRYPSALDSYISERFAVHTREATLYSGQTDLLFVINTFEIDDVNVNPSLVSIRYVFSLFFFFLEIKYCMTFAWRLSADA